MFKRKKKEPAVEPETVTVEAEVEIGLSGLVEEVILYRISRDYRFCFSLSKLPGDEVLGKTFLSCADAFAAIPNGVIGMHVVQVPARRIGSRYYPAGSEIKVTKPKVKAAA